jgi:hypothetical protein
VGQRVSRLFDTFSQGLEKAGGRGAVHNAMVKGEAQHELLTDAKLTVFHDDGFADYRPEAQDGGFRIIDDRRKGLDAETAKVAQGETATLHVLSLEATAAGGFNEAA